MCRGQEGRNRPDVKSGVWIRRPEFSGLLESISAAYDSVVMWLHDAKPMNRKRSDLSTQRREGPQRDAEQQQEASSPQPSPRYAFAEASAEKREERGTSSRSDNGKTESSLDRIMGVGCKGRRDACPTLRWAVMMFLMGTSVALSASAETTTNQTTVILVVGAPGASEYGSNFVQQAQTWSAACAKAGCRSVAIGLGDTAGTNDLAALREALASEPREGTAELWLVLIGHGTFDGKEARFNLRGPDFSASELAEWLRPFRRPLALIDTSSCSGPFLKPLSATNRVVITATRSGHEQNFTRFGTYLAAAFTDPESDLDKDGQVSLLEAFLTASRKAEEFYKNEGRLATEHALLDDNGDGLGTPAEWFRGIRAVKKPKEAAPVDGALAGKFVLLPSEAERALSPEQRARRDELERTVMAHIEKKSQLEEEPYYRELEKLLLELARFTFTNSPGSPAAATKPAAGSE